MRVGQDLHLNVTRPAQIPLNVDFGSTEVSLRFPGGGLHRFSGIAGALDHFHASAAAAVGSLNGQGPADFFAESDHLIRRSEWLGSTGDTSDPHLFGGQPRADLVAHHLNRLWRRS